VGHPLDGLEALADELGALAAGAVTPVSDLHGAADYKRDLTRVFTRRALHAAVARARGRRLDARYTHAVVV
jgi:CO/xanthine dehydrogenase FAD-binding subunit